MIAKPKMLMVVEVVAEHEAGTVVIVRRRYGRPLHELEVHDNLRRYPLNPEPRRPREVRK